MTDAFISYSRKDSEFARRLNNELAKLGRDIWIDWEDIPRGVDFLNEIYQGIESTNTFMVVVSQHSMISEICSYEIAHARKCNKRIIPIIRQKLEGDTAKLVTDTLAQHPWAQIAHDNWSMISHLNWLFFDTDDDAAFAREFDTLIKTLETDLDHVRQHTRLYVQALEWQRKAHNPSFLLIGDEITTAEVWLANCEAKQPAPDPLHAEYITASRHAEDERVARLAELQRRTRRSQRAALIAMVTVVLAMIGILVATTKTLDATTAERTALAAVDGAHTEVAAANATLSPIPPLLTQVAQKIANGDARLASLDYASESSEILQSENGNVETAALLAIRSLNIAYSPRAETVLRQAIGQLYTVHTFVGHTVRISSVAYSPDGKYALTGSGDGTARLWDLATGIEVHQFPDHTKGVGAVAFSPDGKYIATVDWSVNIHLWNGDPASVTFGTELHEFSGSVSGITAVTFSPDGKYLASGSFDGTIQFWDLDPASPDFGKPLHRLIGHLSSVSTITYSADGKRLMTASNDTTARLWNVDFTSPDFGEELYRFIGDPYALYSAAYSADGKYVLTGGYDRTAHLWDADPASPNFGQELRSFYGNTDAVTAVALSPDGQYIATGGGDATVRLWDLLSGRELRRFKGHSGVVRSIVFSPDGQTLLTGDDDYTARLWDADIKIEPRQF
ncbi:MAG TPA: TIR domain-containing protein, partial [Phototrophicaceae bacterium]|nr:TIR domain-containing protein [Phototrophicaceae bacterium]